MWLSPSQDDPIPRWSRWSLACVRFKDCNSRCLFDFEMPHLAAFLWIPAEQCWLKAGWKDPPIGPWLKNFDGHQFLKAFDIFDDATIPPPWISSLPGESYLRSVGFCHLMLEDLWTEEPSMPNSSLKILSSKERTISPTPRSPTPTAQVVEILSPESCGEAGEQDALVAYRRSLCEVGQPGHPDLVEKLCPQELSIWIDPIHVGQTWSNNVVNIDKPPSFWGMITIVIPLYHQRCKWHWPTSLVGCHFSAGAQGPVSASSSTALRQSHEQLLCPGGLLEVYWRFPPFYPSKARCEWGLMWF